LGGAAEEVAGEAGGAGSQPGAEAGQLAGLAVGLAGERAVGEALIAVEVEFVGGTAGADQLPVLVLLAAAAVLHRGRAEHAAIPAEVVGGSAGGAGEDPRIVDRATAAVSDLARHALRLHRVQHQPPRAPQTPQHVRHHLATSAARNGRTALARAVEQTVAGCAHAAGELGSEVELAVLAVAEGEGARETVGQHEVVPIYAGLADRARAGGCAARAVGDQRGASGTRHRRQYGEREEQEQG
jgi:hypothetical protein